MTGTFPLNVQAGSPQYTTIGEITPSSGTTSIAIDNPNSIELISNAYYTIQNADGSKWCTFYVEEWVPEFDGGYIGHCTYSSSNTTDVFPGGSICWCIWCKEYYDSLIAQSGAIQNITAVYTPISGTDSGVGFGEGSMILPMIPGVTYSGELRCRPRGGNITIQFTGAGFKLISTATERDGTTTTVSIPDGTCMAKILETYNPDRYLTVYPHTVTYQ